MKNFKKIIYLLMLLMILSCSSNEEIFETKNQIETNRRIDFEHNGPKIKDPNASYSLIKVTYAIGTTEFEKQTIRFSHGLDIGLFSWFPDSLDSNVEHWEVESISKTLFDLQFKQHLEDEDEVTGANWQY